MPMTVTTVLSEETEQALAEFVENLPSDTAATARTLARAWASGGGGLNVGKVAVRFTAGAGDGAVFTAGTLHAPRDDEAPASLELCRVLLESHGVSHDDWVHWSDEFADLAHHGFDPEAKFPRLPLGPAVTAAEVARLATGLRDLARMAGA